MNIDALTIKDAKQLLTMFSACATPKERDWGFAVVVADRAHVYVGYCKSDGEFLHMTNAQNIRIWGTTGGLAELVLNGPTKKTILDGTHMLSLPMRAVISIHPSNPEVWGHE